MPKATSGATQTSTLTTKQQSEIRSIMENKVEKLRAFASGTPAQKEFAKDVRETAFQQYKEERYLQLVRYSRYGTLEQVEDSVRSRNASRNTAGIPETMNESRTVIMSKLKSSLDDAFANNRSASWWINHRSDVVAEGYDPKATRFYR